MKDFGTYLCNLRTNTELSLEQLAGLIGSSKSTLSRLENNEVPKPFKGSMRKLVLNLAEFLCHSKKEVERYLDLADFNQALLTEIEEFQLGYSPQLLEISSTEVANVERWEHIYEELVRQLESKHTKIGSRSVSSLLQSKLQHYTSVLENIRQKLGKNQNTLFLSDKAGVQATYQSQIATLEKGMVVGYMYGKEINKSAASRGLYTLASPNAQRLLQLGDLDSFAVDDLIVLTQSPQFTGWKPDDILTTTFSTPLPIPHDIKEIQQKNLSAVEQNFTNSSHYRLGVYTPAFSDRKGLEVTIAPLGFYDYYSLLPVLDEPLATDAEGNTFSLREKYGHTAFTYTSVPHGSCLIPAPISLQCLLITHDQQIVFMQRSPSVAFYPGHWSASFEETMNAPGLDPKGKISRTGDADFFACAIRGLEEEFGISTEAIKEISILSLNIEYLTLSVGVVAVIKVHMTANEVKSHWLLKAPDKDEASKFASFSSELSEVIEKLFTNTFWHPTSRMRLIQFLFHTYGVDEVAKAIEQKK